MSYIITARRRGARFESSRDQATAAINLALKLVKQGYAELVITDPDGTRHDLEAFQRRHLPQPCLLSADLLSTTALARNARMRC